MCVRAYICMLVCLHLVGMEVQENDKCVHACVRMHTCMGAYNFCWGGERMRVTARATIPPPEMCTKHVMCICLLGLPEIILPTPTMNNILM